MIYMEFYPLQVFLMIASEKSFSRAAEREHVSQPSLSQQIHKLEAELNRVRKGDKKLSGSILGTLHRAWIDTKVGLGGGDKTVLEWLEHGEDRAKDAYQKALSGSLPASLMEIIRRQAATVQQAHDKVKNLRDTAEAAAAA